jgi:hypothetical protein
MRFWCLLCLSFALAAQSMPETEGETLAGTKIRFPSMLQGKPAVLVFSFSKEAGEKVPGWMKPLLERNENAYSVANLEAAPRFIRGMIRRGMRGMMPAEHQARGLVLTQNEKAWRALLNVKDDKIPWVARVDASGKIVQQWSGAFDPRYLEERK